jgi:hypothetical protein
LRYQETKSNNKKHKASTVLAIAAQATPDKNGGTARSPPQTWFSFQKLRLRTKPIAHVGKDASKMMKPLRLMGSGLQDSGFEFADVGI